MNTRQLPRYYECPICGLFHAVTWEGDCRDNRQRFACDTLDDHYGPFGWEEVDFEAVHIGRLEAAGVEA